MKLSLAAALFSLFPTSDEPPPAEPWPISGPRRAEEGPIAVSVESRPTNDALTAPIRFRLRVDTPGCSYWSAPLDEIDNPGFGGHFEAVEISALEVLRIAGRPAVSMQYTLQTHDRSYSPFGEIREHWQEELLVYCVLLDGPMVCAPPLRSRLRWEETVTQHLGPDGVALPAPVISTQEATVSPGAGRSGGTAVAGMPPDELDQIVWSEGVWGQAFDLLTPGALVHGGRCPTASAAPVTMVEPAG